MSKKWEWLASTYHLQSQVYGYPLDQLRLGAIINVKDKLEVSDNFREDLAEYIDWNVTAAVQELAEVREEFSWKPWATDPPFVNRDRIRDEVIDVLHFLGNILVGLGISDEELEGAYQRKQDINRQRQASGNYSARKGGLSEGSDNAS